MCLGEGRRGGGVGAAVRDMSRTQPQSMGESSLRELETLPGHFP